MERGVGEGLLGLIEELDYTKSHVATCLSLCRETIRNISLSAQQQDGEGVKGGAGQLIELLDSTKSHIIFKWVFLGYEDVLKRMKKDLRMVLDNFSERVKMK